MNEWEEIYSQGQQLNLYPYPEIVRFLHRASKSSHESAKTAIDYGLGSGVHMKLLNDLGWNAYGIDYSASAISFAEEYFKINKSNLIHGDLAKVHKLVSAIKFDLSIDRLSSTHSSKSTVRLMYKRPELIYRPGAKLIWFGFDDMNTHKQFAKDQNDEYYSSFYEGKFKIIGRACFFSESEVNDIFSEYKIERFERVSVKQVGEVTEDSYWIVECEYDP